jgi:MFS family permease
MPEIRVFFMPVDSSQVLVWDFSVVLGKYLFMKILWCTSKSLIGNPVRRPLYNAELASPELRGLLVSFYQFATILGMMSAFWIGYGSNNIGGTGETQSNLAWQLPSIIQGIPACLLALGIWWMPFSPRWLVKQGRVEEARKTLAWLRKLPIDDALVQVEFLEIQAEALFEQRAFAKAFPDLAAKEKQNVLFRELAQYVNCVRTKDNFKRVATAWLVMFFQQWSGIDSSMYTV